MTLPLISATPIAESEHETAAVTTIRRLRSDFVAKYRPIATAAASPIRVQARMVNEVIAEARRAGVPEAILRREVVNRTIGDVSVRMITEVVDGVDYSTIGEDLGLILPGETINGRVSEGRTYLELRDRMMRIERRLIEKYELDLRNYDIYAVGNPLLRERLAERFQREYGLPFTTEQTYVSIGGLDAMDKTLRALNLHFGRKYGRPVGFAFPAPGFAVCLWQAESYGMEVINFQTAEADQFKLTAPALAHLLATHPNLHVLYLTVSNNPTAFSYSPDELRAVLNVLRDSHREVAVLADLAYIGTGIPADDRARMAAFNDPAALNTTIFISSLSKVYTLTGDRMGWAAIPNPEWATILTAAWNNSNAGLPAEWQLRYLANIELFDERPWIQDKIRALYALRRRALRRELERVNAQYHVFEHIGDDDDTTIYNWSKLRAGEDVFTVFEKTGIAGVDGRGFGYSDRYIRFSVGFTPAPPEELHILDQA